MNKQCSPSLIIIKSIKRKNEKELVRFSLKKQQIQLHFSTESRAMLFIDDDMTDFERSNSSRVFCFISSPMNSKHWLCCADHSQEYNGGIRHRNNHNSECMHDDELVSSSPARVGRKRHLSSSSRLSIHPLLLLLIRFVILLLMLWTVYSTFLAFYRPKPSSSVWTRLQQTLTGSM